MGILDKVFGGSKKTNEFSNVPKTEQVQSDEEMQFSSAEGLLAAKRYDECIHAFETLATRFPAKKARCEERIAAARAAKG